MTRVPTAPAPPDEGQPVDQSGGDPHGPAAAAVEAGTATVLPSHGPCFICGPANEKGMGLVFLELPGGRVEARFSYEMPQQGPPGHAHGGAIAAVLDEVMGAAVWRAGHPVLLAHIELDYRHPVPLGRPVVAAGWVESARGKQVRTRGELRLPDGRVATEASGLFIHAPHLFEGAKFWSDVVK